MTQHPDHHRIAVDDGWSIANEDGVSRRTLVASTAWSVPVVALAVATPAAAASTPNTCADQTTNLTATGIAWNDGANGGNASGTHNGGPVYGANAPLFSDLYLRNSGQTTISRVQAATSLEMTAHDSTAATGGSLLLSDGTVIPSTTTIPVYEQGGLRWVFTYVFDGVSIAPGQTFTFRTSYTTTSQAGANYVPANPYQNAIPTQALCNGSPVDVTDSTSDNEGQTTNTYYVLT